MKFKSKEKEIAYHLSGWRERYAMETGNTTTIYIGGHKCLKFTYSSKKEYQDANGATYNTITKKWIN